ncbi:hypothetical protein AC578_5621 [Pseudocercospora eumusae]|uniref:Uncharacterized protein n=1 Tax=Pseudocercospora eumusae TaxID=321146 RepID=A0A139HT35_9PEZI|nr:hypothetical protein AC578_5621 [Pseudocercospora eumusae]
MSHISMDAAGERDPFLFRSRKPEKEPSETGSNSNRAKVTSISDLQKPSMSTSKSSINLREPHIVRPQSSEIAEHYSGAAAGRRNWAINDEEKPLRPGAFYLLMGMRPQLELFAISDPLDQPAGLYHDIKAGQRRAAMWFRRLDQLIIVALLTQVLLTSTILFLIGLECHFQKIFLVFSYFNMILAVVVAYAKCSEILSRTQKVSFPMLLTPSA